jgi:hypothetical protein
MDIATDLNFFVSSRPGLSGPAIVAATAAHLIVRLHEDGRQAVEPVLERDRCEFGQQEAK